MCQSSKKGKKHFGIKKNGEHSQEPVWSWINNIQSLKNIYGIPTTWQTLGALEKIVNNVAGGTWFYLRSQSTGPEKSEAVQHCTCVITSRNTLEIFYKVQYSPRKIRKFS